MKKRIVSSIAIAGALALVCLPRISGAAGPWEGVVEMKMTAKMGSGGATISIGKGGVKTQMSMTMQNMPMSFTTLVKSANRDLVYMIDDNSKTYNEIDVNEQKKMAA